MARRIQEQLPGGRFILSCLLVLGGALCLAHPSSAVTVWTGSYAYAWPGGSNAFQEVDFGPSSARPTGRNHTHLRRQARA